MSYFRTIEETGVSTEVFRILSTLKRLSWTAPCFSHYLYDSPPQAASIFSNALRMWGWERKLFQRSFHRVLFSLLILETYKGRLCIHFSSCLTPSLRGHVSNQLTVLQSLLLPRSGNCHAPIPICAPNEVRSSHVVKKMGKYLHSSY